MQLLERTDVVQRLLREVEQARRGSGGVVLLRGEAGIGKTSVATVLAGAASGDVRVLRGWCDDLLAPRALGPFWDMAVDDPALSAALHDDDPRRQHRGVLDALVHTRRPTVVVVEDVHWADSRVRNPASPSISKITGIFTPQRRSTS